MVQVQLHALVLRPTKLYNVLTIVGLNVVVAIALICAIFVVRDNTVVRYVRKTKVKVYLRIRY